MQPASSDNRGEPLDPRVYLAAERTLLAWVRTGLAMMGFGFVVARFGLFLRELSAVRDAPPQHASFSLWAGTSLIVLGVAVNAAASLKHWHTVRGLEQGRPLRLVPWSMGFIVAWLLGVLGLLMAIYLVLV